MIGFPDSKLYGKSLSNLINLLSYICIVVDMAKAIKAQEPCRPCLALKKATARYLGYGKFLSHTQCSKFPVALLVVLIIVMPKKD